MEALLTAEERTFRTEIGARLCAVVPDALRDKVRRDVELTRDEWVAAQAALHAAGLAVPHWPQAWGGADWTATQRSLYLDQMQRLAIPAPLPFNVDMIGPVLAAYGTPEQQADWLPGTAALDIWWCQGFSEPEAGSDLASLRCAARREGDAYRVNGQKTWTSYAHHADLMFALVRTDPAAPKKQLGITLMVIDMRAPGVTVRPIATADGRHEVNEVFLDDVAVPLAHRIGAEGQGWDIAKFLLANERHNIAGLGWVKMRLDRLHDLAQREDGLLWRDPVFRHAFLRLEVETRALGMLQHLALTGHSAGGFGAPGDAASVLKLRGSVLQQETTRLLLEVLADDPDARADAEAAYVSYRKLSVYGGSNEIQREILAKTALGL